MCVCVCVRVMGHITIRHVCGVVWYVCVSECVCVCVCVRVMGHITIRHVCGVVCVCE